MACPVDLLCFIKSSTKDVRVEAYNYESDGKCALGLVPTLKNVGDETIEINEVRIGGKDLHEDASIPPDGYYEFDFSEDATYRDDQIAFIGDGFEITGTIVHREGEFDCPSYTETFIGQYWFIAVFAIVLVALVSAVVISRSRGKSRS